MSESGLDRGGLALIEADLADVERRIEDAERRARRHTLWILLGLSPGAIPVVFAVSELGVSAIMAVVLLVFVVEGWRALGARREIRELEIERIAVEDRRRELERGVEPTPEVLDRPPSSTGD